MSNAPASLVLGAMYVGTRLDDAASFALFDRFVELGGRWIDTSDNYAFWEGETGYGGQSETVLGRWLAANRGVEVRLSTKVGAEPNRPGGFPHDVEGLAPATIRAALGRSLQRLGVDHVDRYWAHVEDPHTPYAETVRTFGELTQDGVIGSWGVSNHPSWLVERGRALAEAAGLPGPTAWQQRFSYVQPRPFAPVETQPIALGELGPDGLDFLRRNPQVRGWVYTGLLRGAYDRDDRPLPEEFEHPGTGRRMAVLSEIARSRGLTRGQVVLAWLAGGDPALVPILGGSTVRQLEEAWVGVHTELTEDERARLDAAT